VGTTEIDDFEKLPASLRFFAGGDSSVRGYGYKSIGVRGDPVIDDKGREKRGPVIGGRDLLVTSIEYDRLIRPQWAVAVFYDQGDAANNFKFDMHRSVGFGIRWISPIGPVRFDIACALDDERCGSGGTKGFGFHFSIGPDL